MQGSIESKVLRKKTVIFNVVKRALAADCLDKINFEFLGFVLRLVIFLKVGSKNGSLNFFKPFKSRIKSHLLFAGIIRSSPFSPP